MMTKQIRFRSWIRRAWNWLNDHIVDVIDDLKVELSICESRFDRIDRQEPRLLSRRRSWLLERGKWEHECYRLRILIDRLEGKR